MIELDPKEVAVAAEVGDKNSLCLVAVEEVGDAVVLGVFVFAAAVVVVANFDCILLLLLLLLLLSALNVFTSKYLYTYIKVIFLITVYHELSLGLHDHLLYQSASFLFRSIHQIDNLYFCQRFSSYHL
ncbi:MAG: hypothetical protein EXX96DRAFT_576864 [Benjaminiella poitrasii]|nr:MAG: hypothetical protein EXX96DRAFT_576864 [Benjaminiella poitrasii]